MSLRLKVFLPLLLLGALLSGYVGLVWLPDNLSHERSLHLQHAQEHASSLSRTLLLPVLELDLAAIYGILDEAVREHDRDPSHPKSIRLEDARGRVIYPLNPPTSPYGEGHVDIHQPVDYLGEQVGTLVLTLDMDAALARTTANFRRLVSIVLGTVLAFIFVAGLVTEAMVRRPVARLSDASDRLRGGDFDAPLPAPGTDEVGRLVGSFRSMRDAIRGYQLRLEQQVAEQLRAKRMLAGRSQVLERLAAGAPLQETLEVLVQSFEQATPGAVGSALLLDPGTRQLRHGAGPSLPDFYNEAIDGLVIGPEVGSCGAAAHSRRRVIVEDILADPRWEPFRDVATRADLRACWSEPILSAGGETLGTFAVYYREPRAPSRENIEFMATSAHLARVAIERRRTEQALAAQQRSLQLLQRTAEAANRASSMEDAMETCLSEVSAIVGCAVGHAFASMGREPGNRFASTDLWKLADRERFEPFRAATMSVSVKVGAGLVGRVLAEGQPVWLERLAHTEGFRRAEVAEACGFQSGFAFPVVVDGEVCAVLEFFSTSRLAPEARLLEALGHVGVQMGRVVERQRADLALRESEHRFRALYDDNPAMFFTVNADGRVISANDFGAAQLGYQVSDLVGMDAAELYVEINQASARRQFAACLREPDRVHRWEACKVRKDGSTLWVRETARVVTGDTGERTILVVSEDVTDTHHLSKQLSHQATHDALTGLVNRREFEHRLKRVLGMRGGQHALCYMDLDQFKVINDTCGHVAGDELLRQLGSLLQEQVRKRDTLARLGGDEFGVLMEHCELDQALRVANDLRRVVEDFRFMWEDKSFSLGVSIGLVPIDDQSENIVGVMSAADAACYAAKDRGRNRIHVFRADDEELSRRHGEMQWVARIQKALEEDRLCLHYQPIVPVSADAGGGAHYELLVRMQDENGQIVPPGAFLPAAERFSLSTRLDRWVVDHAFTWLTSDSGHLDDLQLCSLNLSGHSLGDEEFLQFVIEQFGRRNVAPEKLCFEITETAAISNLAAATRFIKALKQLGCRFALDDFGSGLSSFAYLKNLPVDFLKIDGVFVKDILEDEIDLAMVRSINQIGHVMGKRTIAEFVESEEVLEKLREIGVDYAQGFGIGRPRPIATEASGVSVPAGLGT